MNHALLRIVKLIKNNDALRNCHNSEERKDMWQLNKTSILDWILEQKEDIREKLVKSD